MAAITSLSILGVMVSIAYAEHVKVVQKLLLHLEFRAKILLPISEFNSKTGIINNNNPVLTQVLNIT